MAEVMTIAMPANAIPAKSMADGFAEGKPDAAYSQSPAPDFAAELKAAQAKDKGIAPVETPKPAEPAPPADPPKKPSVPGTPVAPVAEEWKPTGKAAEHWEKLKQTHTAEAAALKAQIDSMKAEIASAKSAGADPEELKTLRESLKQHQDILKDVAIERDPEFQKRYSVREKAAIEAVKNAAGDKADKLDKLFKLPASVSRDEQINELVEELSGTAQRKVSAALGVLDQIEVEKGIEIASRKADFEQRHAAGMQSQQQQQAAKLAEFNQAFESELKTFTDPKSGHPFLMEKPGDAAYNKEVQASRETATALHQAFLQGQLTAPDIAKAMLHVAVSERMMKAAQEATARAEKAEKALDRLRGAQPGDGRNGKIGDESKEKGPEPGTDAYRASIARELKEAQQRDRMASQGRAV